MAAATVGARTAGEWVRDRLLRDVPVGTAPDRSAVISGFWPLGDEIDTRPTLIRFHEMGWRCGLPVTGRKNTPLTFREWVPGAAMAEGRFGVMTPLPDQPELDPDVLLVPLLAFDRQGFRLGYGGGFYDRTLERLRAMKSVIAVGVAFAAQEVAAVPRHDGDQPLDWLVTERETFRFVGEMPISGTPMEETSA